MDAFSVQPRVFVSHTKNDRDFSRALVAKLREAGADVWYDEHNLGYGELWQQIAQELRSRSSFVVILSPDALQSQGVHREIGIALELRKAGRIHTFIPVIARACDVPKPLSDFRYVDFPNDPDSALRNVLRGLNLPAAPPNPSADPAGDATSTPTTVVPASPQVAEMLAEMDAALAAEIAAYQRFPRAGRTATDGHLVSEISGHYIYQFNLEAPWEPADDTPVTLNLVNSGTMRGTVVTASGNAITIATEDALSPGDLARIHLTDDPEGLLRRLRETLKSNTEGNEQLGSKALHLLPFVSTDGVVQHDLPGFRPYAAQLSAIRHSIGSNVTYIIGPPGTGKTATLAAIAYELTRLGRSVLIAAHTNIAVDNAIVKLGKMLREGNVVALNQGRIIRYGSPQLQSVRDFDEVFPPKIVKYRSRDLERRYSQLHADHAAVLERLRILHQRDEALTAQREAQRKAMVEQREARSAELGSLVRAESDRATAIESSLRRVATSLRQAKTQHDLAAQDLARLVSERASLETAHAERLAQVHELTALLKQAQNMNPVSRLLKNAHPARVSARLAAAKQEVWNCERFLTENDQRTSPAHVTLFTAEQTVLRLSAEQTELQARQSTPPDMAQRMNALRTELARYNQQIIVADQERQQATAAKQQEQGRLNHAAEGIAKQLADVEQQLRDLEKELLAQAQVVATTLSKIYMDSQLRERRFDAVILDEVSMAPLPAVYVAASRADTMVVAIGDPKQLSPIKQAKTREAERWLGRDLFEVAGVVLEGASAGDSRSVLLDKQFRMDPAISRIAREHVYSGLLEDGRHDVSADYAGVAPLPGKPLVLCDTSDANPFTVRPGGSSRINMYHALCAVAVARQTLASLPENSKNPDSTFRVGIATPYRKQAELIQRLIKAEGMEKLVRVGTIHRFQGLESEAIVFDTVESPPYDDRHGFIAGGPGSGGERLINVAITRAQHKLVIVANARHVLTAFGPNDTLAQAVKEAQHAASIHSRSVVGDLTSAGARDLRPSSSASLNIEWLDEQTFFSRFLQDVRNATRSIVICSPFVRVVRTETLIDDFAARCAAGVRVTVVASQPSARNQSIDQPAWEKLQRSGVEVQTSPGLHEKLVIIDERIVYFGSLNPLSHNATTELMQRVHSTEIAQQLANITHAERIPEDVNWGEEFSLGRV